MNKPNVRVGNAVFIIKDSQVLMQQRRGSHGTGTWATPGGHMEFGESLEDSARREVLEETGLTIKNIRFGGITDDFFPDDNKHYITIWLLSDWDTGKEHIAEPDKCIAQKWVTFDTLPSPLFKPCWDNLLASDFIDEIRAQVAAKSA